MIARGIGYEIIPEEKWTTPLNSDDRSGNIFALPNQVVYLKPFVEAQYNSYHYIKLTQLSKPSSGRGLENERNWEHLIPMPEKKYVLELLRGGKVIRSIEDRPYYVKQRPGNELGYDILEFDRASLPAGTAPTFTAFKLQMPSDAGYYQVRLVDSHGNIREESQRELRTVRQPKAVLLLVAALAPIFLGIAAIALRNTKCRTSGPGQG